MKKVVCLFIIFSLTLGGIIFSPGKVAAFNGGQDAVHNIFIDTLYGVGTGVVLALAYSLANEEEGTEHWTRNIGAGAVIGGFAGALYGVVVEYRGMAEIKNNSVCFHIPTINFSSRSDPRDVTIHADLLQFHF